MLLVAAVAPTGRCAARQSLDLPVVHDVRQCQFTDTTGICCHANTTGLSSSFTSCRARRTSTAATRATPKPPPGLNIRAPTSAVETLTDTSAAPSRHQNVPRCAFRIGTSASPTSRPPRPETMRRIAMGLPRPRATQTASRCRRPTAQTSARDLGGATCRRTCRAQRAARGLRVSLRLPRV